MNNKYDMKMFKTAILFAISLLCVECSVRTENSVIIKDEVIVSKDTIYLFDTSINGQIFLRAPDSIIKSLGDIVPLIDFNADLPYAYILNNSQDQYLKMYFYPGDENNCASLFEIGMVSDLSSDITYKISSFDYFYTENNIMLGISRKQIEDIKGVNYEEGFDGENVLLTYIISNQESNFLKKYGIPIYIEKYCLKNDKLINYSFGFEYP